MHGRVLRYGLGIALVGFLISGAANAALLEGQTAPNFTKDQLDAPAPAARSLSNYAGKVVVLFLQGYN